MLQTEPSRSGGVRTPGASETYTSKDGRVTVSDSADVDRRYKWAVRIPSNAADRSFYVIPKALFPDPQLLADQVAEQQPKPRYVVVENGTYTCVRDTSGNAPLSTGGYVTDFANDYYPDARERAEQAAAELNSRCTVASDGNARAVSDD